MTGLVADRFDVRTALITLALVAVGLLSIYSATYDAGLSAIAMRQLIWVSGGLVIMIVVAFLPFRFLQFIAFPSYFASILMLVTVLLLGKTVSGSQSWFSLGPLRLQPSEFAKVTTALALASYISRTDVSLRSIRNLAVATGIVAFPTVLILLQPDAGTTVIYAAMFLVVLYWGGASHFTIVSLIAPPVVVLAALFGTTPFLIAVVTFGALLYFTKENRIVAAVIFSLVVLFGISVQFIRDGLKPYQQKRIETFLDPGAYPRGAGYNVLQSKVAIGSGGLWGKGYLEGTQTQLNFIPEQWTDFIFCVPGEEFGFMGATTVLLLFLALLVRGIGIASTVKNSFGSILAIGLTGIFIPHVLINIGMALGVLPVIGVPLPFLSYGGSALVTNLIMVGLLMNLYANRKEH
jgi:rod shape determining protein RodA